LVIGNKCRKKDFFQILTVTRALELYPYVEQYCKHMGSCGM